MKKILMAGTAVLILATLFTACGNNVEPTPVVETVVETVVVEVTATPEITEEPTVAPTEVPVEPTATEEPEPTTIPSDWRMAIVTNGHVFYQKTGEYNAQGRPFMENAGVGKAEAGTEYLCKWPIQADGEKFCEVASGEFAGYFLRVKYISWKW